MHVCELASELARGVSCVRVRAVAVAKDRSTTAYLALTFTPRQFGLDPIVLCFSAQAVFSELAGIAVCCDGTSCCVVDDLGIRHIDLTTATSQHWYDRAEDSRQHLFTSDISRLLFCHEEFVEQTSVT
jgi:hypothetical protein